MSATLETTTVGGSSRAVSKSRLLCVAAVFPALIACATYLVVGLLGAVNRSLLETTLGFAFFVLEVGLVGAVVARAMPNVLLRWIIFAWIVLLIDLLSLSLALQSFNPWELERILPPAALCGAQIGLAIIWGVLGDSRWYWRVPTTMAFAAGVLVLWMSWLSGSNGRLWTEVLFVQSITLIVIAGALRVRGYRLINVQLEEIVDAKSSPRFQFGIRDVLIGTTVLAVLLGLLRSAEMLTWVSIGHALHAAHLFMAVVAVLSAIAIIFALWSSLGKGRIVTRCLLLFTALLILGATLGAWSHYGLYSLKFRRRGAFASYGELDQNLRQWYDVGWWWIAWMLLSGGLLAASLIIFRTVGYRLVRSGNASNNT